MRAIIPIPAFADNYICLLWAVARGHAGADDGFAVQAGRLARRHPVFCGHEYTLANLRFARAVEPANPLLRQRQADAPAKLDRGEPTVPSTIAEERATNPSLRVDEPAVRAAAELHAGRRLADRVAVFAEVRAWKNAF
jgi:hydroxyacylglutathione hydrolase